MLSAWEVVCFGGFDGYFVTTTEKFNGTSWTTGDDLNVPRYYLAGGGLSGNAISMGGHRDGYSAVTETLTDAEPFPPRFYMIWI
jgi:hypothetical protein